MEQRGDHYGDDEESHEVIVRIVSAAGLDRVGVPIDAPYCFCEVPGKPELEIITQTIAGTSTPRWDHEQELSLSRHDVLHFTIWNSGVDADEFLGMAELELTKCWPNGFSGQLELKTEAGQAIGVRLTLEIHIAGGSDDETKSLIHRTLNTQHRKEHSEIMAADDMAEPGHPRRGEPMVFGAPAPTSAWTTFGATPSKPKLPPAPQGWSAKAEPNRNEVLHALLLQLMGDKSSVPDVLDEMENELRAEVLTSPSRSRSAELRSREILEGSQFKREKLREFERAVGHYAAQELKDTKDCPRCAKLEEQVRSLSLKLEAQDSKNCGSCFMLREQLKAVAQSLAGLGHSMLKWSEERCGDNEERTALWESLLNFLDPVRNVDTQLADVFAKVESTCTSPPPLHMPSKPWRHVTKSQSSLNSSTSSSVGPIPPLVESKALHILNDTSSRLDSPSDGYAPLPTDVTVQFTATVEARNLCGVYPRIPGLKTNKRPVYARGVKHLVHLGDGTWVVKDGPEDDVEADVYAYVRDNAENPCRVQRQWQVPSGCNGFVADGQGAVLPGRVDAIEKAATKREEAQLRRVEDIRAAPSGAAAIAAKPRYRLSVKICSAEGLRNADLTGASDPYCVCQVPGKPTSKIKTKVIQNTSQPTWDHEQEVLDWSPTHALHFSVWDDDMVGDDLLGRAELKPDEFWPMGFVGTLNLSEALAGESEKGKTSEAKLNIEVIVPLQR